MLVLLEVKIEIEAKRESFPNIKTTLTAAGELGLTITDGTLIFRHP